MDGVDVLDDEWVAEFFEYVDLEFDVFYLCLLDYDLLDGHEGALYHVDALVDDAVAALAQHVQDLVLLDLLWTCFGKGHFLWWLYGWVDASRSRFYLFVYFVLFDLICYLVKFIMDSMLL